MLRLAPALTLGLLLAPLAAGLAWTVLPALGYLPAIGARSFGLHGWQELFAAPGFESALVLTLRSGLSASLLSLLLAIGFCAMNASKPPSRWLRFGLAPILASPPSAVALGLAFMAMPSGWLVRLISPWATGWQRPPTGLAIPQDPLGIGLTIGLLIKEVPYLVLMIGAAATQVPVQRLLRAARALGQPPALAWLKAVFPLIYPQIRLPLFAVMAFALSSVDVAVILAPSQPPPLAVLATRWFLDYDLARRVPAAAAAVLQFGLVLAAIGIWCLGERLAGRLGRRFVEGGRGLKTASPLLWIIGAAAAILMALGLIGLAGMGIWSIAGTWRFPDAWPVRWQLAGWRDHGEILLATASATAAIGFAAVALALTLTLACLENEARGGRPASRSLWLLYLPLLVPQIGFLFGVQVALIRLNLDGTFAAVVWIHLIFVMPYVFLSLADPFRALDHRQIMMAAALGARPWRIFWRIKLPVLLRPILVAVAVGFAVSLGLYLPTSFAGAGRIATLTTEAVTLSGSADRRLLGMLAVLQAGMPLAAYGLALALPALIFRSRRLLAA